MGGGSAAATHVDSITSPRRADIEKELRLEITAREELRKELEFLEKGGNPLDSKFSLLAAEFLSSELDVLCIRNTFNCGSLENGYVREPDEESVAGTHHGIPENEKNPETPHWGIRENGWGFNIGVISDGPVMDIRENDEGKKGQTPTKKLIDASLHKEQQDDIGNGDTPKSIYENVVKNVSLDADQSSMCRFQSADAREIGISISRSDLHQDGNMIHETENVGGSLQKLDVHEQDGKLGVVTKAEEENILKENIPGSKQKGLDYASMSAAERKAHEDMILEEAENIKATRKQIAEMARRKPGTEPPRRKSHWDFVLEEMAWLANDFMQERLWKTAAAAQVCRWTFLKTCQEKKYAAKELKKHNKRIAHKLAHMVQAYWESSNTLKPQGTLKKKENNENEAVPMEVDAPANIPALQKYVLRASNDMEFMRVPDKARNSLLDFEQFAEESLFFIVPVGAFEAYRLSVEKNWDSFVSEKILQDSLGEQRVPTCATSELDFFGDDSRSSKIAEDEYGTHYMPGELTISKKKRKRILKSHTPKALEIPGYAQGSLSPAKRPAVATNSFGVIPPKRMRTSAVAARQRAASNTLSPGGAQRASSASTNSQQDDFLNIPTDSRISESDSVGPSRKGALSLKKKKKKTKAFHSDDANSHFKTEAESSHHEHFQQEQLKRKNDQYSPMSSELDTPGTPGSQGIIGMQPTKKLKSSKHSPDLDGPSATQNSSGTPNTKLLRQNSTRDRIRRTSKASKGHFVQSSVNPPGVGVPWSAIEDQAILALVHDLGPNWELVSDVLSSSSQLKGIFRKPKDCKERHKVLADRLSNENGDNLDDPGTSQHLPGIPKGSARVLLQRLQGPMEEDTVKVHIERIVNIVQNHRSKQQQNDSLESQELLPVHQSHLNTVPQYATNSPLDFCDLPMSNGEMPGHGFALPGLGLPGVLAANGMRPNSGGLPLLSHLGPIVPPGSAAMNAAAAARDAQRMAASMRPLSAEEQRLRYTRMVAGRSLQSQANAPGGLPLAGLPNTSDCTVPMLPSGSASGLMGLNRGLSLPRPGLSGMMSGSPGIVGIPPGGGIPSPAATFMKRIKEGAQLIRSGRCTEEQKQQFIQELQHYTAQGNHHAATVLNSLNMNAPSNHPMVSSPTQTFIPPQQPPQQTPQLPPQLSPQQHAQQQQAYLAAVRHINERQQQERQQQQQQKRMFQPAQQPHQQQQSMQQLMNQQQQLPSSPNHQTGQPPQQQPTCQLSSQHKPQVSKVGTKTGTTTTGRLTSQQPTSLTGTSQQTTSLAVVNQQQLPSPPGSSQSQRSSFNPQGKQPTTAKQGQTSNNSQSPTPSLVQQQQQKKAGSSQTVPAAPSTPPPSTSSVQPQPGSVQRRPSSQGQGQGQPGQSQRKPATKLVNTMTNSSLQSTLTGPVKTTNTQTNMQSPYSWKPGPYNLTRTNSGTVPNGNSYSQQGQPSKLGVTNGRTLTGAGQRPSQQAGSSSSAVPTNMPATAANIPVPVPTNMSSVRPTRPNAPVMPPFQSGNLSQSAPVLGYGVQQRQTQQRPTSGASGSSTITSTSSPR